MSDGQGDVPGYFVGRPMNYAESKEKEPQEKEPQAADEQNAANTQTPGDYFVGRPSSLPEQQPPQVQSNRQGFLAKCCPCLAGGGAAE